MSTNDTTTNDFASDLANDIVVVTRHQGLVDYLRSEGLLPPGAEVVQHATPESIRGRHVIGVLPLTLAALAAKVTVVPLSIPRELRGVELSEDQVRALAGPPETYVVMKENEWQDEKEALYWHLEE